LAPECVFYYDEGYIDNIKDVINDMLISVYPNPTTGELTICGERYAVSGIEVYDVYGRWIEIPRFARNDIGDKFPFNLLKGCQKGGVVKEGRQPQADGVVINISHLPAGIYFLRIESGSQTSVCKIVKQ
jgi:hypothetical protein